jgi:dUTP pyrophosphatase
MKVRIRRAHQGINLPKYDPHSAAAFDLAASEDRTIEPKAIALIGTGLYIEVPEGYFLGLFSRSSTPLRLGLSVPHGVGVVDPTYSGPKDEILVQVFNFTDKPVTVKTGDRIAQAMFIQAPRVEWHEADELSKENRDGFGSTGA